MIKFFKAGFILTMSLLILSCNKSDDPAAAYVVPYTIQYPIDLGNIENFLKTHSYAVTNTPEDQDITFAPATIGSASSIWGSDPNTPKSSLLHKMINSNGVDYKVYYISLRDGLNDKPSRVDSVFVSYKGLLLIETVFDQAQNPVWFPLTNVIQGWSEIIPFFKTGSYDSTNANGTVTYADFGAGVMFLPSGLAYYNTPPSQSSIPAYSPLIFTFKLKQLNYVDHDGDRIDSKDEDVNGDGDPTNDDSDLDGRANYYDTDDDGDGYTTKSEIKKPTPLLAGQGTSAYYPFSPILDNVLTPGIDESEPKGIPDASGNGVLTTRLRRHLDPNSKPPFTTY